MRHCHECQEGRRERKEKGKERVQDSLGRRQRGTARARCAHKKPPAEGAGGA